jgi:hypothetical protein
MTSDNPPGDDRMNRSPSSGQLGFDDLLRQADDDNHARRVERETAHLPSTFDEGLAFFRDLIRCHHAAMLAADADEVLSLRAEAHKPGSTHQILTIFTGRLEKDK